MNDNSHKYRTFGTIAALSLSLSGATLAADIDTEDPFHADGLDRGFMSASAMTGDEGSCGEGSCGEDGDKDEEGSCGEGSCGEDSGNDQDDKDSEGACGEGTCGVA